jgi:hypothetical protein
MLKPLAFQLLSIFLAPFALLLFVPRIIQTFLDKKKIPADVDDQPPALLNDAKWGTHQFVNLPGLKMHYVEKGDRNKPLMIFVHGFPDFWFLWRHQMAHFSKDYW